MNVIIIEWNDKQCTNIYTATMTMYVAYSVSSQFTFVFRLKYIMLLKLPIILSGNSFIIPEIIPNLML